MVALLIAAGVVAVFAVNMLLVSAVFALTVWIPGWLAALGLAGSCSRSAPSWRSSDGSGA